MCALDLRPIPIDDAHMDNGREPTEVMPSLHGRGKVTVRLHDRPLFRRLLHDRDMTLVELARAVGCSAGHAQHLHSGHVTRASLRLARRIEAQLNCPGQLFGPLDDMANVDNGNAEDHTFGAAS